MRPSLAGILLSFTSLAPAADLHLHLLDGRTGRPIAGTHVVVLGDGSPALFEKFTTDTTGSLTLRPAAASAFRVFVEGHAPCAPPTAFSVAEATTTGIVARNTCNAKLQPSPTVPGALTLYLRPQTPAEKAAD